MCYVISFRIFCVHLYDTPVFLLKLGVDFCHPVVVEIELETELDCSLSKWKKHILPHESKELNLNTY